MNGFVLLPPSDCVSYQQKLIKSLNLKFRDLRLIVSYILKLKPKQPRKVYFFSLTFFYKDLLCHKQIFKGHLSRSKHLFLAEPILLLFLFDTSVRIRLALAAYVEICISFDIRNSQMTSTATIDLRGI